MRMRAAALLVCCCGLAAGGATPAPAEGVEALGRALQEAYAAGARAHNEQSHGLAASHFERALQLAAALGGRPPATAATVRSIEQVLARARHAAAAASAAAQPTPAAGSTLDARIGALLRTPNHTEAHLQFALFAFGQERAYTAASWAFQRAAALAPAMQFVVYGMPYLLMHALQHRCAFADVELWEARLEAAMESAVGCILRGACGADGAHAFARSDAARAVSSPYIVLTNPVTFRRPQLLRQFLESRFALEPPPPPLPHAAFGALLAPAALPPPATSPRRLHVGYITGVPSAHVTYELVGLLPLLHSAQSVALSWYALHAGDTAVLKSVSWFQHIRMVDLSALAPADAAAAIRADGVHALVDLDAHIEVRAQPPMRAQQLRSGLRPSGSGAGCARSLPRAPRAPRPSRARRRGDLTRPLPRRGLQVSSSKPAAVLSHGPAPVVCQWLGWPATSAHPRTHYAGLDAMVAPPASAAYFSEKLSLLPHTYQANNHALKWAYVLAGPPLDGLVGRARAGGPAGRAGAAEETARLEARAESLRMLSSAQYGLDDPRHQPYAQAGADGHAALLRTQRGRGGRGGRAVACSFNQLFKMSADVFSDWRGVLRRAAPAAIVQGAGVSVGRSSALTDGPQQLHAAAHADGANADAQLFFAQPLPKGAHLRRMSAMCDLALDTLVYNSHTTGADALWSGAPLVTLRGESMASRVAASLSVAAGMPDTTVFSHREYADYAAALLRPPRAGR